MNIKLKKGTRNWISPPTVICIIDVDMAVSQKSQTWAVEINLILGACGGSRWDGESNDNVHEFWYGCNSKGSEL